MLPTSGHWALPAHMTYSSWRRASPRVYQKPKLTQILGQRTALRGRVQGCVGGFLEQVVVQVPQVQTSLTLEFTLCYLTESVYCPLSEPFRAGLCASDRLGPRGERVFLLQPVSTRGQKAGISEDTRPSSTPRLPLQSTSAYMPAIPELRQVHLLLPSL